MPILNSVLIPVKETGSDSAGSEPWSFHNLCLFSGIDLDVPKISVVPFVSLTHSIPVPNWDD